MSLGEESAADGWGLAGGIRADVIEEAERRDVALRLPGGVAIKVRSQDGLEPAFEREYADLDWITPKGKSSQAQRLFESLGYVPQTRFNARMSRSRLAGRCCARR